MSYIVIIDDSPTIRTSVEFAIRDLGHQIQQAENGSDALNKILDIKKKGDDEIVLCIVDINMPVMDGVTFIKEFRKIDKFTPLLVLTTESEDTKIQEGKDAGASGWLVKPFKPEKLVEIVSKLAK